MKRQLWITCLATLAAIVMSPKAHAVVPGQIDTFEGGTAQGWTSNGNLFDSPLPTGGPGGASDHFISVNSGTFGGKSRWVIFNHAQWKGDYLAAGVRAIGLDLKNQDTMGSMSLRLAVLPALPFGSTTPGFVSNDPIAIPADGQWHHAVFLLTPSAMTLVFPPDPAPSLAEVLSEPAELRLFIAGGATPTSVIGDDNTNAKIGLDNMRAVPLGDFNFDNTRTAADIQPMLAALADLNQFKTAHQLTDQGLLAFGDVNSDGKVTNADVQSLLNLLKGGSGSGQGSAQAVPEPCGFISALVALAALCRWWLKMPSH